MSCLSFVVPIHYTFDRDRNFHPLGPSILSFLYKRSEFELIGNGYAETALQNRCGLECKSGGEWRRATAMPKSGLQ